MLVVGCFDKSSEPKQCEKAEEGLRSDARHVTTHNILVKGQHFVLTIFLII